jgi:hypothetical protein
MSHTAASSSTTTSLTPLGPKVTEKLTRDNYVLWKAQVLPPIRGARLIGFLDGSAKQPEETMEVVQTDKTKIVVDNPEYATWLAHDQIVLAFLYNSISKEILGQVATMSTACGRRWKQCSQRNLGRG